jgi:TfoX/Sxy family transcriptional regulator of competence genes
MASPLEFVEFVVEQMSGAGDVSFRPMFGAHTVYCDGKVVGLINEDKLFVKPTEKGKAFIGDFVEAPPYPGARMFLLIEDQLDDALWLQQLISITAGELPLPKKKKPKKPRKT